MIFNLSKKKIRGSNNFKPIITLINKKGLDVIKLGFLEKTIGACILLKIARINFLSSLLMI